MLLQNPKKLERRSKLCLFVGYLKETKGGLFYDSQENRVSVSTNATFLEKDHVRNHQPRRKLVLSEISKQAIDKTTRVVDQAGSSTRVVDGADTSSQSHPSQELRMPRRSGRVITQPDRYLGLAETQVIIPDDGIDDLFVRLWSLRLIYSLVNGYIR